MSQKPTSVKPSSKEGDNIFDTYYNLIEKTRLKAGPDNKYAYYYLQNAITIIERNLTDVIHRFTAKSAYAKITNNLIDQILTEWLPFFSIFSRNVQFVNGLAYNFFGISLLINNNNLGLPDIQKILPLLSPSFEYQEILALTDTSKKHVAASSRMLSSYQTYITAIATTSTHYSSSELSSFIDNQFVDEISFKLSYQIKKRAFKINLEELDENVDIEKIRAETTKLDIRELLDKLHLEPDKSIQYLWEIRISTTSNPTNAVNFISLINTFLTALQLIDNDSISIELVNWGNGSKWADFRVWFKTFLSREETKQVLSKAEKAISAELFDKRIGEADKLKAEALKTGKEAENLMKREDAELVNEMNVHLKRLEIFEKQVDIEQKLEDLKAKKIDNFERISQMIKNGVVNNDSDFKLEINNLLFVEKDKKIILGENLDAIDGKSSVRRAEDSERKNED